MIKVGDILTLETKYAKKIEKYQCKVADIKPNTVLIDYPVNLETGRTAFLLDGTQLKGYFVTKDGSAYLFDCEVTGKILQNIPLVSLSYPQEDGFMKIQRRQYVRVSVSIDVAVHPETGEWRPFTAVTDDISAGGASIIASKSIELNPNMSLTCWFVLLMSSGEYHYLKLKCKVIRLIDMNEHSNRISLQFSDVSGVERQLLLRYCFDQQISYKRKGIIQN